LFGKKYGGRCCKVRVEIKEKPKFVRMQDTNAYRNNDSVY